MSAKIESGLWVTKWRKKKASTAFVQDSLVTMTAGFVAPADSDSGKADEPIFGLYEGPAIASGSATTVEIPVFVPIGPAVVRITATGTLATTDEGKGFDMSDSVTVNAAANTYKAVTCAKFISTTEGLFYISKSMYANVA